MRRPKKSIALISSKLQQLTLEEAENVRGLTSGELTETINLPLPFPSTLRQLLSITGGRRVSTLFLGDIYLRVALLITLICIPERIIVLEDGGDGRHAVDQLLARRSLLRHGRKRRTLFGFAQSLVYRKYMSHGRLRWLTCETSVISAAGISHFARHNFETLRRRSQRELVVDTGLIIGSALAVDGYIDEERYSEWIEEGLRKGFQMWPHIREVGSLLVRRELQGQVLDRMTLCVEEYVAALQLCPVIKCLPMTAAYTLKNLRPAHCLLEINEIPSAWWTPKAAFGLIESTQMITASLRGASMTTVVKI